MDELGIHVCYRNDRNRACDIALCNQLANSEPRHMDRVGTVFLSYPCIQVS
jgi:hypothetical protein